MLTPAEQAEMTKASKMKSMNDMIVPAMASPRGCFLNPTSERMAPNIHMIHPRTGTHDTKRAMSARTNPPMPKPFPSFRS